MNYFYIALKTRYSQPVFYRVADRAAQKAALAEGYSLCTRADYREIRRRDREWCEDPIPTWPTKPWEDTEE